MVVDEVGKFWIVTSPTEHSVIEDILFEADVRYMMNQCRGGLKEEEIKGIFLRKHSAETLAIELLSKREKC